MPRGVGAELHPPGRLQRLSPGARIPRGVDPGRDVEGRVAPAELRARGRDFLLTQCCAVHVVAAGLVRRSPADHRLAADQRRTVCARVGDADGGIHRFDIVPVHASHHLPAVRLEPLRRVVREPALDVAVDGDAVVVVEADQLVQAQRPGQRRALVRDAFHETAVADETRRCGGRRWRNPGRLNSAASSFSASAMPTAFANALAERPGGRLHARGHAVLGMARRLGVELAEALQLVERQIVAGQMQQRVQQHRAVPVRKHEAIAIRPARIDGVVPQMPAPQCVGDLGHAHRHARVAGVGFLHGVHRQNAQCVGRRRRPASCRGASFDDMQAGHRHLLKPSLRPPARPAAARGVACPPAAGSSA